MRVLLDYRPALRQRTGVGEYAHQIAAALVRTLAGSDRLTLFSSSWRDRLPDGVLPGAAAVDVRIPVRALNYAWHRLGWPPVERLARRAGPIDVAHAMHPLLIPAERAAQVVTVHDLYFLDHPERTSAEIRRDYPALAASHARRADAVIVVSEHTRADVIARFGIPPERIAICPPGAPAWAPRESAGGATHVLFIGTLEPRKNVGALLRAYARLVERRRDAPPLLLAGRVTPESAPLLEALQRPPLASRARHVGYVSDARREQLYRDAFAVVLPSFSEGFGMPALEAMSVGVPVVAANRGALPWLVGDAAVLIDPEDDQAIADGIERVLDDTALAQDLAARGPLRAAAFTWDASARRLIGAYADAIARKGSR